MSSTTPIEKLKRLFDGAPNPLHLTIDQIRKGTEQLVVSNPPADDLLLEETEVNGVPAMWLTAPDSVGSRVILYLHGGGFVAGSAMSHRSLTGELARHAKARVLAVDYSLAPEKPFPVGLNDCLSAYQAISSDSAIGQFAIAGDSAGGGLALSVLMAARDKGWRLGDATVLFSPWVDLTCSAESHASLREADPLVSREFLERMAGIYLGNHDCTDPAASPLFGSFEGLPPIFIQVGACEVLLDDSVLLERKAKQARIGVTLQVWPEMIHVWQGYTQMLPEAGRALEQTGRYLESIWNR